MRRRRAHTRRPPSRLPVIVVAVALLLAGIVVDRRAGAVGVVSGSAIGPMPAAAPADALSSSWFCAGPLAEPAGIATGTLVLANATGQARQAMVTMVGPHGPAATVPVRVGPFTRTAVPEARPGPTDDSGAVVEIDGGGVAVEQVVSGRLGTSAAACATGGSGRWYFADGTTELGATLILSLLNPYPEDAIVDLSFVTEAGAESPDQFQGIVVPGHSLVAVDVGGHLRGRAQVATTVTVRAGRAVAWKTQVVSPAPPAGAGGAGPPAVPGLSLSLGAPSPATTWWWPDGLAPAGVVERYRIYNPGPTEADVSLSVILDEGSAEPFRLRIGPHDTATVDAGNQSRIPEDVGHAAVLQSAGGVGVVAERTVTATSPSPHTGLTEVPGARVAARRWVLPGGSADSGYQEWLEILNPGPAATDLSIASLTGRALSDLPGLSGISLPPGQRLAVRINDDAPGLEQSLLVDAHADVVVERDLYPAHGPGLIAMIGIPVDP